MSKKKSRRQRKKQTTTGSSSVKTSVAVAKEATIVEPEASVAANTSTNEADNIGLDYIRSDIRKTVFLSGFIIVFYTIMYYLLQRTNLIQKATQILGLGS